MSSIVKYFLIYLLKTTRIFKSHKIRSIVRVSGNVNIQVQINILLFIIFKQTNNISLIHPVLKYYFSPKIKEAIVFFCK